MGEGGFADSLQMLHSDLLAICGSWAMGGALLLTFMLADVVGVFLVLFGRAWPDSHRVHFSYAEPLCLCIF